MLIEVGVGTVLGSVCIIMWRAWGATAQNLTGSRTATGVCDAYLTRQWIIWRPTRKIGNAIGDKLNTGNV